MLSPVLLFVYNRPIHTQKVIEALSKNHLAKNTDVYIFSDAHKTEKDLENVIKTRNYISKIKNLNFFNKVVIYEAERNQGLANSVINGVNRIINKYGKVIVLEDDLVTSNDFLDYMNEALYFYENNSKIWSISGYNLPINIPSYYSDDVYLSYRASSWGWATWRDCWIKTDWEVRDYQSFKDNYMMRNSFNRGGRDLSSMLDDQIEGKIDSWAIRWCFSQWKNNMVTVYPVVSKVRNIGLDGTGTHSGVTSKYDVSLEDYPVKTKLSVPDFDYKILKSFQNYYVSRQRYLLSSIKRLSLNLISIFVNKKQV